MDRVLAERSLSGEGEINWAFLPRFSRDGNRLAISRGNRIEIHAVAGLESVIEMDDEVSSGEMFFSASDKALVINSPDGSRIYDILTSKMIAAVHGWSDGEWLIRTPDNYYDASLHGDQHIIYRVGDQIADAAQYRELYRKPDIVRARLAALFGNPEAGSPVPASVNQPAPLLVARPPVVTLLSPAEGTVVENGEVMVRARAEDVANPVVRWHILVNERPLEGERGISIESRERGATLERTIPLIEGVNRIQVIAENSARVRSDEAEARVTFRPPRTVRPRAFVLAIGLSDYRDDRLDLCYAAKDARDLARSFETQQGKIYETVETRVLADSAATRSGILRARDEFLSRAAIEDVVVIFVAGHGIKHRGDYYFLTYGANPEDPYNETLTSADLEGLLANLVPPRRLLFLDACNSGAAMGERGVSNYDMQEIMRQFVEGSGIYVVSASASREAALESNEWGNGAFTKALIEGLSGRADGLLERDGAVSIEELKAYVSRRVVELTNGRQHPTYPLVRYGRDFPLSLTGEGAR